MTGVRYAEDLPNGPRVKRINAIAKVLRTWTTFHTYPTQDLSSAATGGIDRAPEKDEGVDHFNLSICHPGLLNMWLDCRTGQSWF